MHHSRSAAYCLLLLLAGFCSQSFAQVSLTFPTSRVVFQRDNTNQTNVPIAGNCPANATSVQARMVVRAGQSGTTTGWQMIDVAPANGSFQGSLTNVTGGWYDLAVKAFNAAIEVGSAQVERVGVGEVFVTAGQSNSWGGSFTLGQATDDRVSIAASANWSNAPGEFDESQLPLTFSPANLGLSATVGMAPMAPLGVWGALGDRLAQRLGVPVLFFGASRPGSRSFNWANAAAGAEMQGDTCDIYGYCKNAPYRSLGAAILHYLKRTGVRAVLWHQGESDNFYRTRDGTPQQYIDQIGSVIAKTRSQSGFANLSWVVSRASYVPAIYGPDYVDHETDPIIIAAQDFLASQPNNWPGPATDSMIYPNYRVAENDHIHFGNADVPAVADVWSAALSASFFNTVQPSVPTWRVLLTTGYVFPFTDTPGQVVTVPYLSAVPVLPGNQYTVDLLTEGGCSLTTLTAATTNPISVTLPAWANGRYRFRVRSTAPAITGEANEPISVTGSGSGLPPGATIPRNATLRNGRWDEPGVWSCGFLPGSRDVVDLNHVITIPATLRVQAQRLRYGPGSRLIYGAGSRLVLSQ
jgi:hypothetical protein